MRFLTEKICFVAVLMCFAATMFACGGSAISKHEVCEETPSEIVEISKIEAISQSQRRRGIRNDQHTGRFYASILKKAKKPCVTRARIVCKSFVPPKERDHLNGHGVYQLI